MKSSFKKPSYADSVNSFISDESHTVGFAQRKLFPQSLIGILQRSIGNNNLQSIFCTSSFQEAPSSRGKFSSTHRPLILGRPQDALEQEADVIAENVMSGETKELNLRPSKEETSNGIGSNVLRRWGASVHKSITTHAGNKVISNPDLISAVSADSALLDLTNRRLYSTGPRFLLGITKGEGPAHGEDGNYSIADVDAARSKNLELQNYYRDLAIALRKQSEETRKQDKQAIRSAEIAVKSTQALGNACHIAQDRGSHGEGVKGRGHDDPRTKNGWDPDDVSDNPEGYDEAIKNTSLLFEEWKQLTIEPQSSGILRRTANDASTVDAVPPIVYSILRMPGQPLDNNVKMFMERSFNQDFSEVRVHIDSDASESAKEVNALAYTVGQDVVFQAGHYAPQTNPGRRLIAHELAHVAQQQGSSEPPMLNRQQTPIEYNFSESEGSKITVPVYEYTNEPPIQRNRQQTPAEYQFSESEGSIIQACAPSELVLIEELINRYSNDAISYFASQIVSAIISFQLWYKKQKPADAAFFSSVVDLFKDFPYVLLPPAIQMEAGVIPLIGSIIQLIAQQSAKEIQDGRDAFSDSLVKSANNFKSGCERRLTDKVFSIIKSSSPTVLAELCSLHKKKENWKEVLHRDLLIPEMGANYHLELLELLITKYKYWGVRSRPTMEWVDYFLNKDPYGLNLQENAKREASRETGNPLP